MKRRAFVFLPVRGVDMAVGVIDHVREGGVEQYHFRYGSRYLQDSDAYSIDPRQLPLKDQVFTFRKLPLAFQDNGPDDFGRYLFTHIHGRPPESELDYHLTNGSHGIGALSFSTDITPPKASNIYVTFSSLEELFTAYQALERRDPLDPKMQHLLSPGASLGGARPKALLVDGKDEWIVKFNRDNDVFNIAIAEQAAMTAAMTAGIRCADSQLVDVLGNSVYLTKRFDRENGQRRHYLSAYTLLGADNINPSSFYEDFSYPAISRTLKVVSPSPMEDRKELFKRMLFNVMCGNRDDHLKNHGFLLENGGKRYRLSPCFDVVPGASSRIHAIGIGDYGPIGNLENALSQASQFCIETGEVAAMVHQVRDAVSTIPDRARNLGMDSKERKILRESIEANLDISGLIPAKPQGRSPSPGM